MRKTLVLGAVLVGSILISGAKAQALTINPQIGVNTSILSNDPGNHTSNARVGWQVGGYLRFDDQKRLYIQPGIFWHNVGTEVETKNQITQETQTFQNSVHSIQIPVVAGFNLVDGGSVDLRLQAGTAIDFITSVDDNNYFTQDDLESNYWSFKFALGVDLSILSFDLGYDLGMSNYFVDERGNDGKMSGWFLNAGVRF